MCTLHTITHQDICVSVYFIVQGYFVWKIPLEFVISVVKLLYFYGSVCALMFVILISHVLYRMYILMRVVSLLCYVIHAGIIETEFSCYN